MPSVAIRKHSIAPLKRRIAWQQVIGFSVVHALAIAALFVPSSEGIALALGLHFITGGLGISLGYHRINAHKAMIIPKPVRAFFSLCGVLAFQGGPLRWAALHRAHHRYTDHSGDPHARSRGFLWSHCAWIFLKAPNGYRYRNISNQVPDLSGDRYLQFMEKHYFAINLISLLSAILVLGWQLTLWAVFFRIAFVWHCTWLVNSLCHTATDQEPAAISGRNHRLVAFLTYGEGLHKNHHLSPGSLRFGKLSEGDIIGNLIPTLFAISEKKEAAII